MRTIVRFTTTTLTLAALLICGATAVPRAATAAPSGPLACASGKVYV
jgi:hypothetical protein